MSNRFDVARQIGTRGAVLFKANPQAPLEKPPYPDLAQRSSIQTRLTALSPNTRAALAQISNPADWNSYFLSAPEMMFR